MKAQDIDAEGYSSYRTRRHGVVRVLSPAGGFPGEYLAMIDSSDSDKRFGYFLPSREFVSRESICDRKVTPLEYKTVLHQALERKNQSANLALGNIGYPLRDLVLASTPAKTMACFLYGFSDDELRAMIDEAISIIDSREREARKVQPIRTNTSIHRNKYTHDAP